jgi:hypothetical protein
MMLDTDKFELMCEAIYKNSVGENRVKHMLDELYQTSRSIGVIKPIGWLVGFLNYISPYQASNPYPYLSLAYAHYEQGRMCAHHSYHYYYNNKYCPN